MKKKDVVSCVTKWYQYSRKNDIDVNFEKDALRFKHELHYVSIPYRRIQYIFIGESWLFIRFSKNYYLCVSHNVNAMQITFIS